MPVITPRPVVPTTPTPTTPVPVTPNPKLVKKAEAALKTAGFNPGTVDGKVTAAFTTALKEFQKSWGLPADGQLNERTMQRLEDTATRVKKHAKAKDAFVSVGQKSSDIKVLEKRLGKLGYAVGRADGIYSRETANAVKAFRADQKELKDGAGSLSAGSRRVLREEVAKLNHAPERRRIAPSKSQTRLDRETAQAAAKGTLKEGAKSSAVANVQKHLRAAGFDPQRTTGRFDERTEGALKAFQSKSGLSPTGVVDAKTWKALQKSFILSSKPAAPAQTLGERSSAVKASEKLLQRLGFNPGKIDGLFDKKTLAAVKAYEKKHELERDGAIGTNQLAKMKRDVKSDYRSKVLETARRYLGFHEKGVNGNPFSKFFGRPPEAWCADFVSYCYTKAGKKLNEPWTPSLLQKIKDNGTWNLKHPKPGDIIMFDWHPGSGRSAEHTGLVEKVFKKNGQLWVQTIEGNSGDAVRRLQYRVGDPRIAGFGTMR
ncbi:MAG: hypothetical protein DI536_15400 [Archangium gephyra]|uniref:CHAP domain-containing protein n=1 Tax=Archangium gephyra TaxID=48 RepID=A0A2W5USU8_9BACT|nr:MAG: hypothetical protein DI536_15400 [Archangium gephyra]